MAQQGTNLIDYFGTHPGLTPTVGPHKMHEMPGASPFGGIATRPVGKHVSKKQFGEIGGSAAYTAADWTATTTGTSAALARNTNGGVLMTCGSDSTFNTNLQSITLWTPVAQKRLNFYAILQFSDITTVGGEFGIGASAVDPAGTDYTDFIGFKLRVGTGAILSKVRGDAGVRALGGIARAVSGNTTVTSGASSATQTVGSSAGMTAGDALYFGTTAVWRSIDSITNGTTIVLDITLSTTTGEAVTVYAPNVLAAAATNVFIGIEANLGVKRDTSAVLGTGVSSTTQTLTASAASLGIKVGTVLYFVTSAVYRAVSAVSGLTVTVASVSTTTSEVVQIFDVTGGFWAGADADTAVFTAFNSDQILQAAKFLSTPVSCYMNLNAKGSAGNPTVLVEAAYACVDRGGVST